MTAATWQHPGLTLALALASGILAQAAAQHLRLPGIVLLLAAGVALGPEAAGIVRPETLGPALSIVVGFAVAVILFEGGMNLDLRRLRREHRAIRRLVTGGAAVTAAGAALAARGILGWDWRSAALFGVLVIVTGPTVVGPLLRRVRVERGVATVLEAEGVLVDAIGAVVAVVALEVALSPAGPDLAAGALHVLAILGFGAAAGLVGGFVLGGLLRVRPLVPEGLENVFTLSLVLALFQASNALLAESGIVAVTAAGLVVGNLHTPVRRELMEFKEQLTVMLIGMLFVLLAASVELARVRALGWPGVGVVAVLMLAVRPASVWLTTTGAGLSWRQKALIGWVGPRGIVAAAVATLFATRLDAHGLPGGAELRAMVFLVIALTVLAAGLTVGPVAAWLGLRRPSDQGWVILGANELARALARLIRQRGGDAVLVDSNAHHSMDAEREGLPIVFGNGLEERTLQRAEIDIRAGAVGLTPNEEVNLLFVRKAKQVGGLRRLYAAVDDTDEPVSRRMVQDEGAQVLFGQAHGVELWSRHLRQDEAVPERWRLAHAEAPQEARDSGFPRAEHCLALALEADGAPAPVGEATRFAPGAVVTFLLHRPFRDVAHERLRELGWEPHPPGADDGGEAPG